MKQGHDKPKGQLDDRGRSDQSDQKDQDQMEDREPRH